LAIGFGRGELSFHASSGAKGWKFEPRFAPGKQDNLPEDAWIDFLKEPSGPWSTRSDLRPFSLKEQERILEVGSCLTCHDEKSKVMERALENFQLTLAGRSVRCGIN
jgi:hypothetical protein